MNNLIYIFYSLSLPLLLKRKYLGSSDLANSIFQSSGSCSQIDFQFLKGVHHNTNWEETDLFSCFCIQYCFEFDVPTCFHWQLLFALCALKATLILMLSIFFFKKNHDSVLFWCLFVWLSIYSQPYSSEKLKFQVLNLGKKVNKQKIDL